MISLPASEEGLATHFAFQNAAPVWTIALVILPLIGLLAWWSYCQAPLTSGKRLLLGSLRGLSILFIVLLLFRPTWVEEHQEVRPAEVLILIDDSASMARTDAWGQATPGREALAKQSGLDPTSETRAALAVRILDTKLIPTLIERGYVPRRFSFSESWSSLPDGPTNISVAGPATHIGDAIVGALGANATRNVTGALVISDGRNTGGTPLVDASRRAVAFGVPIHTALIGDPVQSAGLSVELVNAPESVLSDDEITAQVTVRGTAKDGLQVLQPRLEELIAPEDPSGRILDETEIELTEAGSRLTLVAPAEPSATTSMRHFLVSVPPLDGEARTDDNQVRFSVRVTTEPIRVLFVDGYPRWEYRFLKEFLKRGDKSIQVRCFLGSATNDFPQEASRDLDPLKGLPTTTRELLDEFDVVILGDINPRRIAGNEAASEAFTKALVGFVEAGGGLAMQAGEFNNPRSFPGTPLEMLLPIKLDPAGRAGFPGADQPFHPQLERPSAPHEITKIESNLETNRHIWEDEDGLGPLYWFFPVERAKAGGEVLLSHPFEENRYGRRPLLITGHYPAGRTLFLAIDSTWRWNWPYGPTYRQRFWKGALRWLALGRLKSGDRRFRIEAVRSSFGLDERVLIGARVLNKDWQGSTAPELQVMWSGPSGEAHRANLNLTPMRPGNYTGSLPVERPGHHRVWIEDGSQERTSANFQVTLPSRESAEPAPDAEALLELSRSTNGTAVSIAEVGRLLESFPGGEERREPLSAKIKDLFDSPWSLFMLVGLLSFEWILRKREDLP